MGRFAGSFLLLLLVWSPLGQADEVRIQLKWRHQFQFAGYYAALEKGFYAEEGLKVRLIEGGPGRSSVGALLRGDADYAVADAGALLYRARGKPVVVLATIFQQSPLALLVSTRDVPHLTDLRGKRVMLQPGHAAEILAMLRQAGIARRDITELPQSGRVRDVLEGRADAMAVYETNEPFLFARMGQPFWLFRPRDHGIDFYGDVLLTTEAEIHEHPERAAAVRRATLRGWRYALDHMDEIIDLIKRKYDTQHKSRAHLTFEAQGIRDLMMADVIPIGFSNPARWRAIARILTDVGLSVRNVDWKTFLYRPTPTLGEMIRAHALALVVLGALLALLLATLYILMLLRGQSRLEGLLSTIPTPLFVSRLTDGALLFVNDQARAFSRAPDLGPHRSTREFYANPEEREEIVRLMREKGGVTGRELAVRLADGNQKWVALSNRLIRFEGCDAAINVIQDITETVHARNLLRHVNEELEARVEERTRGLKEEMVRREQAERERERMLAHVIAAQKEESIGVLASGVAHVFNNLLAIIMGNAELAAMESGSARRRVFLETIADACDEGARRVHQILAYAGKERMQKGELEIHDIFRQAAELAQAGLGENVRLQYGSGVVDERVRVMGDGQQLVQAFVHLLANAAEAYAGAPGVIHLDCGQADMDEAAIQSLTVGEAMRPGPHAWVEVRDEGRGMNDETISRIFDPFFTTKEAGTGLGMSAVLGIMREHRGGIDVDSAPGKGTRVRLYLPLISGH